MSGPDDTPFREEPARGCGCVAAHRVGAFRVREFALRPGYRLGRHAHERSGLALSLGGEYVAIGGGVELLASADRVVVLPADMDHRETTGPGGARCLLIEAIEGAERLPSSLDARGAESTRRPGATRLGIHLRRELGARDAAARLVAEDLLLELVGMGPGVRVPVRAPRWISRVEEIVRERAAEPVDQATLAHAVGVSREHLARTFHRVYGMPLGLYVRRIRLQEAARHLRESARPVSEIAAQTGFSDQSHLHRFFRRRYRLTPLEYRRRCGSQR